MVEDEILWIETIGWHLQRQLTQLAVSLASSIGLIEVLDRISKLFSIYTVIYFLLFLGIIYSINQYFDRSVLIFRLEIQVNKKHNKNYKKEYRRFQKIYLKLKNRQEHPELKKELFYLIYFSIFIICLLLLSEKNMIIPSLCQILRACAPGCC